MPSRPVAMPPAASVATSGSGNQNSVASSAASVSNSHPNAAPANATGPGTAKPAIAPTAAAISSICQCRGSIGAAQLRQRPRCTAALSSGTSSIGRSVRPHQSHADRPPTTDRPCGQRITSVAMKLPRIAPRRASRTGQINAFTAAG